MPDLPTAESPQPDVKRCRSCGEPAAKRGDFCHDPACAVPHFCRIGGQRECVLAWERLLGPDGLIDESKRLAHDPHYDCITFSDRRIALARRIAGLSVYA